MYTYIIPNKKKYISIRFRTKYATLIGRRLAILTIMLNNNF